MPNLPNRRFCIWFTKGLQTYQVYGTIRLILLSNTVYLLFYCKQAEQLLRNLRGEGDEKSNREANEDRASRHIKDRI